MEAVADILGNYNAYLTSNPEAMTVFNTVACDVCGKAAQGPNATQVLMESWALEALKSLLKHEGMIEHSKPLDELGWCDYHGCATCSDCYRTDKE